MGEKRAHETTDVAGEGDAFFKGGRWVEDQRDFPPLRRSLAGRKKSGQKSRSGFLLFAGRTESGERRGVFWPLSLLDPVGDVAVV